MGLKTRIAATVFAGAVAMTIPLIEKIEGVEYRVYRDIAGIPTVCAGITGKDVIPGKVYTKKECDALLVKHLDVAKRAVDGSVKVQIPDSMRASLYSFTFNAGAGAFKSSTMLKLINKGELRSACDQLYRWTKFTNPKTGKKEESRGLKNRRDFEYGYCVKDLK